MTRARYTTGQARAAADGQIPDETLVQKAKRLQKMRREAKLRTDADNKELGLEPMITVKQLEVLARRDKVRQLMAKRLTCPEIARALSVSPRTIEKDMAAIRNEMITEMKLMSVMDVASDIRRRTSARERELWLIYQKADGGKNAAFVKLACLRELRANENQELKSLQGLGLVEEAPKKIQAEVRMLAILEDMPPEILADLAQADDIEAELAKLLGKETAHTLLQLNPGDEVEAPDQDTADGEPDDPEGDPEGELKGELAMAETDGMVDIDAKVGGVEEVEDDETEEE